MFTPIQIQQLESELPRLRTDFDSTLSQLVALSARLKDDDAKEYILRGVVGRVRIIWGCIAHVFTIYPPRRTRLLLETEMVDLNIYLHSFFVNLYGSLDNLAWTLVHERGAAQTIKKFDVGLYCAGTQKIMTDEFRAYLKTSRIADWHTDQLKDFRDSLAHRIPLYVPPYAVIPDGRKVVCPVYVGGIVDDKAMAMHHQLMADCNTLIQVVSRFIEFESAPRPATVIDAH